MTHQVQLEETNKVVQKILSDKFAKPGHLDQTFVDFDSVRYHLSTPEKKTQILFSIHLLCWDQLVAYGALELLQREYPNYLLPVEQAEQNYNVSLLIDLENIPSDPALQEQLIHSFSLLRRNVFAAPFERAFGIQKQLEALEPEQLPAQEIFAIHYRPSEAIYILPSPDRVTVVFSTIFQEETDRIYGKVFLQEFVDARRRPSCQTAPQVLYSNREPPLEIRGQPNLLDGENVGYVTFVLFPRHFKPETISQIQLFRDYLHYHIKCSKAYLHSRMRSRVADFLKILNRAKPDPATLDNGGAKNKTASGRTFVRAV